MPVHNADIATTLGEIADLLELEQANPFRVRAYRSAARVVGDLGQDISALVGSGTDLTELPGVGADLAAKIREIAATGRSTLLTELRKKTPPSLARLLTVPGPGPKRVRALNRALGVRTIDQLARAVRSGRVRELPGFGAKTEENILRALAARPSGPGRLSRAIAAQYAEPLAAYLRDTPGVREVEVAGSDRRCRETVGDLDILVTAGRRSASARPCTTSPAASPTTLRPASSARSKSTMEAAWHGDCSYPHDPCSEWLRGCSNSSHREFYQW